MNVIRMKKCLFYFYGMALALTAASVQAHEADSLRALGVGYRVPDKTVGYFAGQGTTLNLHDLKGTLVILDFWNTYCATCIKDFSRLEQLQREFNDQVRIILVNVSETEEQIRERMQRRKAAMPSLPLIARPTSLQQLFPHRVVPHHVWISPEGVVQSIGSSLNTYREKIADVLAGKEVSFLSNNNTAKRYDGRAFHDHPPGMVYGASFSVFDNTVSPFGALARHIADTSNRTIRSTYINIGLLDLFNDVMTLLEPPSWKNNISGTDHRLKYYDAIDLQITDTLSFTAEFYRGKRTDRIRMATHFCYEQVTPMDLPDSLRALYMLEDLRRAVGHLYGYRIELKKRIIPGWALERTQPARKRDRNSLSADTGPARIPAADTSVVYRNMRIADIVSRASGRLYSGTRLPQPLLFDHTGDESLYTLVFPQWKPGSDLRDLDRVLAGYGFRIVRRKHEVLQLCITK